MENRNQRFSQDLQSPAEVAEASGDRQWAASWQRQAGRMDKRLPAARLLAPRPTSADRRDSPSKRPWRWEAEACWPRAADDDTPVRWPPEPCFHRTHIRWPSAAGSEAKSWRKMAPPTKKRIPKSHHSTNLPPLSSPKRLPQKKNQENKQMKITYRSSQNNAYIA